MDIKTEIIPPIVPTASVTLEGLTLDEVERLRSIFSATPYSSFGGSYRLNPVIKSLRSLAKSMGGTGDKYHVPTTLQFEPNPF